MSEGKSVQPTGQKSMNGPAPKVVSIMKGYAGKPPVAAVKPPAPPAPPPTRKN